MRIITQIALLLAITTLCIAQTPKSDKVVATVNGVDITVDDLMGQSPEKMYSPQAMMRSSMNAPGQFMFGDPESQLEMAIRRTLVLSEAQKNNMATDPDVVAMTEAFKKNLMVEMYYRKIVSAQAKPTEAEVKAEYDNSPRYNLPKRARIIQNWSPNEAEAKAFADKLKSVDMKNPEASGMPIETMQIYDVPADQGMKGDPNMNRQSATGSNMPHEAMKEGKFNIMASLAEAKPGQIIGPIQEGPGYRTMLVIEKLPEGKRPFAEVKEELTREMTERRLNELRQQKENELRKNATVTIYYENLNKAFGK